MTADDHVIPFFYAHSTTGGGIVKSDYSFPVGLPYRRIHTDYY